MYNKQNLNISAIKSGSYYAGDRPGMIEFIPGNATKILEVGCGEGLFGQRLKQQFNNSEVWGVEINNDAATKAQTKIDKVLIMDVAKALSSPNEIPNNYFDCIIFNDILEHLIDPFTILNSAKNKLSKEGVVVCSIPNIRYFFVLKDLLLKKQWQYTENGILDNTHLRFFTIKSIQEIFESLGYEIKLLKGIDPIKSWKFNILNLLSFNFLEDTKYLRFACVAKPKTVLSNSVLSDYGLIN